MTPPGIGGSPQTAAATARARPGLATVIAAGNAKCRWFCGRALTRLTSSRVTAAWSEHSAAPPVVPALPGLAPAGLAVLGGWVALDVVAAWLPQAPTSTAQPAVARTARPGRVRPGRVRPRDPRPGTPMVSSVSRPRRSRGQKSVCPGH